MAQKKVPESRETLNPEPNLAEKGERRTSKVDVDEFDFLLWQHGVDHEDLKRFKRQAEAQGCSLPVFIREQLGLTFGGEPIVRLPVVEYSEYLSKSEEDKALALQESPHIVRYFQRIMRLEEPSAFETELNAAAEAIRDQHPSNTCRLIQFYRIQPGSRWLLTFGVNPPSPQFTVWRYIVRTIQIRTDGQLPAVLTFLNCEIGVLAHLIAYYILAKRNTRARGHRFLAVYGLPMIGHNLRLQDRHEGMNA